ncbi:hypothetical protein AB0E96_20055, partial [Kitasatospora sp. NPDC036755]
FVSPEGRVLASHRCQMGSAPERPAVAPAPRAPKKQSAAPREDGLGDFADIEEILRKRGI